MGTTTSVHRLRKLRRKLTIGYLLVTAACLGALIAIATDIDAHARSKDTDTQLAETAEALSRAVYYDNGVLHLAPLADDALITEEKKHVAVVELNPSGHDWIIQFTTISVGVPDANLELLAQQTRQTQETAFETAPTGQRLAAAPVWNGDRIQAAVIAAVDTSEREARHRHLTWWLILGSAGLLALAGAAGHVLSGRSMRLALRSIDQQEQFLADAAHELRTPLALLQAVAENAEPDALQRVSAMTADIGRLVTGLLLRARLEAGTQPVEHEPLRLDLLVEQVVDDQLRLPNAGDIAIDTEPCIVNGDPYLLTQAVRNLLTNALEHGAGRPVEVTVANGTVTIDDEGPGIPLKDRELVFERHITGPRHGTGIGLSIVRWAANEHQAVVRLTEAPGGGTRAQLAIPLA